MRVQKLLAFLMMVSLTLVSGSSIAAAICHHQNAQAHAAAIHSDDSATSAAAHLEEAAGKAASQPGALVDAGAFSLPAFILPSASVEPLPQVDAALQRPSPGEPRVASLTVPPLLEPPAA